MAKKLEYFHDDVVIVGKHSRYVDELWVQNKIQESYFKRLVDLYTIAAVIGLRMNRKASVDNVSEGKRTIQVKQLMTNLEDLNTIMTMILLLDTSADMDIEKRINRAFRGVRDESEFKTNVKLFNDYVRGGIEVLYEELVQRALTPDDYPDLKIGNIVALLNNEMLSFENL